MHGRPSPKGAKIYKIEVRIFDLTNPIGKSKSASFAFKGSFKYDFLCGQTLNF